MKYLAVIILASITLTVCSQKEESKYYFGFNLMQTMYGDMHHYGIICIAPNGAKSYEFTSKVNFVMQIAGLQDSRANPDTINFFVKYDISPRIIGTLWMLRYAEYPYRSKKFNFGWAKNVASPSDAQFEFLKQYGFENINSFIYGENAFRLLQDMMNLDWVNNYKSIE